LKAAPEERAMQRALIRYAPLLLLLLAWQAATQFGLVSAQMVPRLSQIGQAFWSMTVSGDLPMNAGMSLMRALVSLAVAIVVGVPAGLLMSTSRSFKLVVNPFVQLIYPMPKSALVPLMIIWFGLGSLSKMMLIFLGSLLPIIVSSYNGARSVSPILRWSAASFGATRMQILREVILPAAMPEILNGIRTALALSFILMVTSEFIIAKDGVGFLIASLGDGGAYPAMFAAIFTVAGAGFIADRLYGAFVRRQLRWRDP
jgi:NitT/TauT family transport system permease protein